MDASISLDRIREAARVIDPVFLHTPQYECEPLSDRLGTRTVLKVESVNPIRSFKGRGTDYLLHRLVAPDQGFVQVDLELIQLGAFLKKANRLRHHFGPDTIAG